MSGGQAPDARSSPRHTPAGFRLMLCWFVAGMGIFLGATRPVFSHSASTSYVIVMVHGDEAAVRWSMALRDLEDAIGLDRDGDGLITWGEVRTRKGEIEAYALSRLRVSTLGAACAPGGAITHAIDDQGDGAYLVLSYRLLCPVPVERLDIAYSALFEVDTQHRGLVSVTLNGVAGAAVMAPAGPVASFGAAPGLGALFRAFFIGGVTHLLGGTDHLLFIAMLLAPLLLRPALSLSRTAHQGSAPSGLILASPVPATPPPSGAMTAIADRSPPAAPALARLLEIIRVLTSFTLAHAIALGLAVLGLVHVPAWLAEPAIALTILITAIDNIWPFLPLRRWLLAMGFGLIHGLGVAGSLGPLALPPLTLAVALVAFNLGLEMIQVAIAVAATPFGVLARNTPLASRRVLPVLSAFAAAVAVLWLGQRLEWPPGVLGFLSFLTVPSRYGQL